jgi:hypothetical protein
LNKKATRDPIKKYPLVTKNGTSIRLTSDKLDVPNYACRQHQFAALQAESSEPAFKYLLNGISLSKQQEIRYSKKTFLR